MIKTSNMESGEHKSALGRFKLGSSIMLNISAKILHCYHAAFLQHFISMAAYSQRQSKAKEKLLYSVISVTVDINYATYTHHLGQGMEHTTLFHLRLPGVPVG